TCVFRILLALFFFAFFNLFCAFFSSLLLFLFFLFFLTATAPTVIYTLSLHDALPIFLCNPFLQHMLYAKFRLFRVLQFFLFLERSEEHTSELQSRFDLVCRLLLEKKK